MADSTRTLDELSGTGKLTMSSGYSEASYHLTVFEVTKQVAASEGLIDVDSDIVFQGSLETEHGVNLMQDLDLVLHLEDGRELEVRHATGDMLGSKWEISGVPREPEAFRQ